MKKFSGVYTALITPFYDDEVDYESLRRIVKFQSTTDINGCVISGTTGENTTLTDIEKRKIFDCVKEETGKDFSVIVGTGSYSTKRAIELTNMAQKWGADGALVVVPYYNKPPQRGIVHHFLEISKNCDIPLIIYNVPSRTASSVDLETIEVLSRQKNIVGLKEASGDLKFDQEIIRRCRPDFSVLSGDDKSWMELMTLGGAGVISVLSNLIPIKMSLLYKYAVSNDPEECKMAIIEFEKYKKIVELLFIEANPIPIKMALKLMGFINSAELRSPLVTLKDEYIEMLEKALLEIGILK